MNISNLNPVTTHGRRLTYVEQQIQLYQPVQHQPIKGSKALIELKLIRYLYQNNRPYPAYTRRPSEYLAVGPQTRSNFLKMQERDMRNDRKNMDEYKLTPIPRQVFFSPSLWDSGRPTPGAFWIFVNIAQLSQIWMVVSAQSTNPIRFWAQPSKQSLKDLFLNYQIIFSHFNQAQFYITFSKSFFQ